MLPRGHLAGGAILATLYTKDAKHPVLLMVWTMLSANLPDMDVAVQTVLDKAGVEHSLPPAIGRHHSWPTHTPAYWAVASVGIYGLAKRYPKYAAFLQVMPPAVALHLAQDTTVNSVSLAWPLRKEEYGLHLDGLKGVENADYSTMYAGSTGEKLEKVLVVIAAVMTVKSLLSRVRR